MWSAQPAGPGFFPLDEILGLVDSSFSPFLIQVIVRLGTMLPFEQVPELVAFLAGVHVSRETVRRITEEWGAALVRVQEAELARLERDLPPIPDGPAEQQVSADGAMVPLVGGEWAEARTVASGTLRPDGEEGHRHATDIHYFSRLCSAHEFIRQAALPMYARGVARAHTVVAVMDGADWLQEFIDAHCPDAIRVLDYPHALEYLAKAAQAAFGAGSREAAVWLDTWAPQLKHGDAETVLTAVRALPMPDAAARTVRETVLRYLTKRRVQIAYAAFCQAGYPIGSGMVESGNKLVVEARLKGSGMHWARQNVTPMLALRGILCSEQWAQQWPTIWQEIRRTEADRRQQGRAARQAKEQAARQKELFAGG